jgi:hypothetical protein
MVGRGLINEAKIPVQKLVGQIGEGANASRDFSSLGIKFSKIAPVKCTKSQNCKTLYLQIITLRYTRSELASLAHFLYLSCIRRTRCMHLVALTTFTPSACVHIQHMHILSYQALGIYFVMCFSVPQWKSSVWSPYDE